MSSVIRSLMLALPLGMLTVQVQAQVTSSRVMSKPGNVIEAESLLSQAKVSAGELTVQNMSGFGSQWGQGSQLFWHVPAPVDTLMRSGPSLTLPLQVAADGSYDTTLYFTAAPDFGNVRVFIAGKEAGNYVGYATGVSLRPFPLGQQILTSGSNQLVLTVFGKEQASTNYLVGIDRIEVVPAIAASPATQGRGASSSASTRSRATLTQSVVASATLQDSASAPGGGPTSGGAKSPGPDCNSTCLGNVATVYRKDDGGNCQAWFRFACAPYDCDEAAGLCRQLCQSDMDCAQGSQCDTSTGMCAMVSARCADASTVKMPNGQTQSCLPYKCLGGSCRNVCVSNGDCGSGYMCNSSAGACVKSSN